MRTQSRGQNGASLMELMFTMAIGAVVLVSITRFIMRARGAMTRAETTSQLEVSSRRVQDNLNISLKSADVMLLDYGGSPDTSALRTLIINSIASTGSPAPVTFSAQAVPQDSPTLDRSLAGANYWGNELFFLSRMQPVTFTVAVSTTAGVSILSSGTASTAAVTFNVSVDRVQFVAVYLTQDMTHGMRGGLNPLRLVEWRSKPYATMDVSAALTGAASTWTPRAVLTGTCQALLFAGYSTLVDNHNSGNVLNTTAGANGGFWSISGTGQLTNINAPSSLGRSSWSYLDEIELAQKYSNTPLALADSGRVSHERTGKGYAGGAAYGVAYNTLSPTSNSSVKVNKLVGAAENGGTLYVPLYATADRGGIGFPGGFEVAVFGRAHSREVCIRMVEMVADASSPAVLQGKKDYLGFESEGYVTVQNLY